MSALDVLMIFSLQPKLNGNTSNQISVMHIDEFPQKIWWHFALSCQTVPLG